MKKLIVMNTNNKLLTQYSNTVNEYRSCLASVQTVITINAAFSVGIFAGIAAILANIENLGAADNTIKIILIILSILGLMCSTLCLLTIKTENSVIKKLQKFIVDAEEKLNLEALHSVEYFKPLFITTIAFYGTALAFVILFSYFANVFWMKNTHPFIHTTFGVIIIIFVIFGMYKGISLVYSVANTKYKKLDK